MKKKEKKKNLFFHNSNKFINLFIVSVDLQLYHFLESLAKIVQQLSPLFFHTHVYFLDTAELPRNLLANSGWVRPKETKTYINFQKKIASFKSTKWAEKKKHNVDKN